MPRTDKKNGKIIYANVKIPIEILEDGSINPLKEYIDVDFSPCPELPEPSNIDYSQIMEKIMFHISDSEYEYSSEDESEDEKIYAATPEFEETLKNSIKELVLVIPKEEIRTTRTRAVNSSFKKRNFKHKFTAKAR
jgi:hypothetical protein